jgi:hypothetical protein
VDADHFSRNTSAPASVYNALTCGSDGRPKMVAATVVRETSDEAMSRTAQALTLTIGTFVATLSCSH